MSISEKIDPVKLNTTLTAAGRALDGFGDGFGQSIVNGNDVLAALNPRLPQIRYDTQRLADLPYHHVGLAQPILTDYVWGRQSGEYTINP
jgi:phospholipid/cholesterol/gamma-HCH transport system substrate-binding protein